MQNEVNINVTTSGSSGDPEADKENSQRIAKEIDAAMDVKLAEFARQQSRPGGVLHPGSQRGR